MSRSAAFEVALRTVLAWEGGYSNDPRDPGGETRFGISKRCLDADARVLTADLKWVRCGDLSVGDRLLAFDEKPERHGKLNLRRLRVATTTSIGPVLLPACRITTERRSLVASADHMWLRRRGSHRVYAWATTKDLMAPSGVFGHRATTTMIARFMEPWTRIETRAAGYAAAILDGEGHVSRGGAIGFSQKENACLAQAEAALAEVGYRGTRHNFRHGVWSVRLENERRPYFSIEVAGRLGAERLLARLAGQIVGKSVASTRGTPERVIAVEAIGERELVGISTSTGTLIVEGFLSHNSYPNEDIEHLTRERAAELYERDYWRATGCDLLSPALGIALFDAAVNQGPRAAVKILQTSLGVTVYGVVGFETTHAARDADAGKTLTDFFARRVMRYAALPTFSVYAHGWCRRAFAVYAVCLKVLPPGAMP